MGMFSAPSVLPAYCLLVPVVGPALSVVPDLQTRPGQGVTLTHKGIMYAQAVRPVQRVPAKFGFFLAAWAYLCTNTSSPQPGMREISMEEWNATPAEYLRHPDLHPVARPKFPGESSVQDKREHLFKKYGQQDPSPSVPAAGGHGHH